MTKKTRFFLVFIKYSSIDSKDYFSSIKYYLFSTFLFPENGRMKPRQDIIHTFMAVPSLILTFNGIKLLWEIYVINYLIIIYLIMV